MQRACDRRRIREADPDDPAFLIYLAARFATMGLAHFLRDPILAAETKALADVPTTVIVVPSWRSRRSRSCAWRRPPH
jgi:hypothetical protein